MRPAVSEPGAHFWGTNKCQGNCAIGVSFDIEQTSVCLTAEKFSGN
jgi:hypothetical protein